MAFESLTQLSKDLAAKKISCTELIKDYLHKIAKAKTINAFINYDESLALKAAAIQDKNLGEGKTSLFNGIPVAHKDIFCTYDLPTTCASKMLEHYISPYQATIVERLQNNGVILLGKTNMDEFAMGSSNENSYFGPVKNPWDLDYVAGGSSGGSAAAVAADLTPFATGSDTGGSIRQPSSFCGLSGIKPTYGLVSRFGMVAYASSLDQAGAMAHSVEDLALILQGMAGFDEKDSTSVPKELPNYLQEIKQPIKNLKIGITSKFFQYVDPAIQQALQEAIKTLEKSGATIIDIDFKLKDLWIPCYYVIACAEASSNLQKFDGIRYGYRSKNAKDIQELIKKSRSEGFGNEVKRRIITGTHLLSAGYFDDYYVKAQKVRRMIQQEYLEKLAEVDLILSPTTPTTAFQIGKKKDENQKYSGDIFTVPINLSGLPAMSIPIGFDKKLPIGMQLIGKHFAESIILNVGNQYQQLTDWHKQKPSRSWENI